MTPYLRTAWALGIAALLLSAATAQAQFINPGMPGSMGTFPGMMPGQMPGLNAAGQMGISPQVQQYMMLRALQGAGHHHGVHTGYMNPIIGAGPQFDPSSVWMQNGNPYGSNQYGASQYGSNQAGGRHSSSERRAAARAAREEQKQLTRERAERNKAKAAKAGKAKFSAS